MSKVIRSKNAVILCGLIFLLASCSIQKRRYRPGFYIPITKKYGNTTVPKTKEGNSSNDMYEDEIAVDDDLASIDANDEDLIPVDEVVEEDSFTYSEVEIELEEDHNEPIMSESEPTSTEIETTNESIEQLNKTDEEMKTDNPKQKKKLTKRQIAIIIGISLLLMALIAGFSATTIGNIFVMGNPAQTALNLSANWGNFIGAIIGWIGIFILDILVSVGVLKYYKKERPKLSKASGLLRLVYTIVLGGAITQLIAVNLGVSAISIYNFIKAFNTIWGWGLIVFGVHLIALGILYHNEGGKKWFNILIKTLLIMAGVGYLLQYIGILVVANPVVFAATVESIFLVAMIFGEVLFALWMLIKGGKG